MCHQRADDTCDRPQNARLTASRRKIMTGRFRKNTGKTRARFVAATGKTADLAFLPDGTAKNQHPAEVMGGSIGLMPGLPGIAAIGDDISITDQLFCRCCGKARNMRRSR